jgi:hypothetical protein
MQQILLTIFAIHSIFNIRIKISEAFCILGSIVIKQLTFSLALVTIFISALHSMEKEKSTSQPSMALPQEINIDIIEKLLCTEYDSNNLFDFFKRLHALTRVSKDFSADVASQHELFSSFFSGDRFEFACYSYLMPLLKTCLVKIARNIATDHKPLLQVEVTLIQQLSRLLLQVQTAPEPLKILWAIWSQNLIVPALNDRSPLIAHLAALSIVAMDPNELVEELEEALSLLKRHAPESTAYSEQSSLLREMISYLPILQRNAITIRLSQQEIPIQQKDLTITDIMILKFHEIVFVILTNDAPYPDLIGLIDELLHRSPTTPIFPVKYRNLWKAIESGDTETLEILLSTAVFEEYLSDTILSITLCIAPPTARVDIAKRLLANDIQPFFLLLPLSESLLRGNVEFSRLILKSMHKLNRQDQIYLSQIFRARLAHMSDELIMLCCERLKWPPLMSELLIHCKNGNFEAGLLPSDLTLLKTLDEPHLGIFRYAAVRFGHLELLKVILDRLIQQDSISPREIVALVRMASQFNHPQIANYLTNLLAHR